MNKKTIYSALPIVAATYGQSFSVDVVIGNDDVSALTNGKTIVIPNVPEDYPNMDAVWGYLAHEAGHVRFSDLSFEKKGPLHAFLTNVIEDCRIEREMMRLYPGTSQTLNATAIYISSAGYYKHVTKNDHPANIVNAYCLYWLRSKVVGQKILQPYMESAEQVLESLIPKGVIIRLKVLLRQAFNLKSTADAVSLAFEIIKMIEEEKEDMQNSMSNNTPNIDYSSQSNGNDPVSIKSDKQDSSEAGDSNIMEEHSKSEFSCEQGRSGNSASILADILNAKSTDLEQNGFEQFEQELNNIAQNNMDSSYHTIRQAMEVSNLSNGLSLLDKVNATTSKIKSQLYGIVQASQRVNDRVSRRGSNIVSNKLYRVVVGDTRVFSSSKVKKKPNTAVHILVDMSGSMQSNSSAGTLANIASESALAISMALCSIHGVNPAVTYFCGKNRRNPVYSVLKHGEYITSNNVGKFVFSPDGGTPLAEGLWYAAFELSKTKENRKMLIVLTDGAPDSRTSAHKVIQLCENSGVEVIGIGIGTESVTALFSKNIVIDSVTKLETTLFRLMEHSLAVLP